MAVQDLSFEKRVTQVASPLAKALHIDLVEVSCRGRRAGGAVRVTIDKPGGVSLDDCEQLHQSLSRALNIGETIPTTYRLEVSSPGLDRPLTQERDYRRAIGKLVRINLVKPVKGNWVTVGRVEDVNAQGILLIECSKTFEDRLALGWDLIAKARLEVEF